MGSPAFHLKLPEAIRPWHDAGLTHVLRSSRVQIPLEVPVPATTQPSALPAAQAWPSPWDMYWNKASKCAQVLFTYFELGADLAGRVDPKRSALFKDIINHLGWNGKGVVSFWPLASLQNDLLRPEPDIFWDGAVQLGVQHVACFGASSASLLVPDFVSEKTTYLHGSIQLHLFSSPDELLALLPHERHLAVNKLAALRLKQA